jgi:hypothetical protein
MLHRNFTNRKTKKPGHFNHQMQSPLTDGDAAQGAAADGEAVDVAPPPVPTLAGGLVDVDRIRMSDKDHRQLLANQLGDVCRHHMKLEAPAAAAAGKPIASPPGGPKAAPGKKGAAKAVSVSVAPPAGSPMIPVILNLVKYDDVAVTIAQALPEVLLSIGDPLPLWMEVIDVLLWHHDLRIVLEGAAALRQIVDMQGTPAVRRFFVAHVFALAGAAQWSAPRTAGAALLASAFTLGDGAEQKATAKRLFEAACRDKSVLVRRAAVAHFASWQGALASQDALRFLSPLITLLTRDPQQDSLRYGAVPQLLEVAKVFPPAEGAELVMPLIMALCQDESWRVRWTAAKHMTGFMRLFPDRSAMLVPSLVLLADDEEAEVRSVVASAIGDAAGLLDAHTVSENLVELTVKLCQDDSLIVRAATASSICHVCCHAGDAKAAMLLKVIHELMLDTSDKVQLAVLASLPGLEHRLAASFSDLFVKAGQCSKWRVRERVAEQLRHFCDRVAVAAVGEQMRGLCVQLLVDDVAAVRSSMVVSLALISSFFGPAWTQATLRLLGDNKIGSSRKFSERLTFVRCLEVMLPHAVSGSNTASPLPSNGSAPSSPVGSPLAASELSASAADSAFSASAQKHVLRLATDEVSNVRVAVGKLLTNVHVARCAAVSAVVPTALAAMRKDGDADVKAATEPSLAEEPF